MTALQKCTLCTRTEDPRWGVWLGEVRYPMCGRCARPPMREVAERIRVVVAQREERARWAKAYRALHDATTDDPHLCAVLRVVVQQLEANTPPEVT